MYMGGAHQDLAGVGSLSRRRYTKCGEHNRKGRLQEQEVRGPTMDNGECAVCYGAKKRQWPADADTTHTSRKPGFSCCAASGR
jgi:hypothetical protein